MIVYRTTWEDYEGRQHSATGSFIPGPLLPIASQTVRKRLHIRNLRIDPAMTADAVHSIEPEQVQS